MSSRLLSRLCAGAALAIGSPFSAANAFADDSAAAPPPAVSAPATPEPSAPPPSAPPAAPPLVAPAQTPPPASPEPGAPAAAAQPGAPMNTLGEPPAPAQLPSQAPAPRPANAEGATQTLGQPPSRLVFNPTDELQVGLRGFVQIDGRHDELSSGTASPDDFYLRRIRPDFRATAFNTFEVRLQPEFAGTTLQVLDAYVDVSRWKMIGVRVGKFKTPLSLEVLEDTDKNLMVETSLSANLAPNRDIGAMVYGEVLGGGVTYQLGVLEGTPDGSSNPDTDEGKEGVARLFFQPFVAFGGPLHGFGLGAAGSIGHADGSNVNTSIGTELPSYVTAGQDTFLTYRTGVLQTGSRSHLSLQSYWHWARLGLFGEFLESNREVDSGKHEADLHNHGIQGTATLLLTRDEAAYNGVVPTSPFDPSAGHFGALELAARVSQVKIDPATFPLFASPTTSSQSATEVLGGLTWYANAYVKFTLNGGETLMDGGKTEQLILGMVQGAI